MISSEIKYVLGLIFISFFLSCASTGNPSGGPKDETPPKIIEEKSQANFQTNYTPEKFELHFDEWIELKDIYKQFIVSPPMVNPPKVKQRGKKITVDFSESDTLRQGVTYTLNFGQAIVDFREGNALRNYSYVFSTGDFIDSLQVNGKVTDSFTKEPVEDMLVMLYDNLEDSSFYKERPFYFSRTDEEGLYDINYLKSDTFRLVALADANLNYRYDGSIEKIAFLDTLIILTDSSRTAYNLEAFEETLDLRLLDKENDYKGLISLIFNQRADTLSQNFLNQGLEYTSDWSGDTLKFWHKPIQDSFIRLDILNDTLKFKNYDLSKKDENPMGFRKISAGSASPIPIKDSIYIHFNSPITKIEGDSIILQDTSKVNLDFEFGIDTLDSRRLWLFRKWKADLTYDIRLLPGAVEDYFGQLNDSISLKAFTASKERFGLFNVFVEDLSDSLNYVLQLKQKDKVLQEYIIQDTSVFELVIQNLKPGDYRMALIEDLNSNGKWDPGNFLQKKQSEKIIHFELENLRANWELDVPIKAEF